MALGAAIRELSNEYICKRPLLRTARPSARHAWRSQRPRRRYHASQSRQTLLPCLLPDLVSGLPSNFQTHLESKSTWESTKVSTPGTTTSTHEGLVEGSYWLYTGTVALEDADGRELWKASVRNDWIRRKPTDGNGEWKWFKVEPGVRLLERSSLKEQEQFLLRAVERMDGE